CFAPGHGRGGRRPCTRIAAVHAAARHASVGRILVYPREGPLDATRGSPGSPTERYPSPAQPGGPIRVDLASIRCGPTACSLRATLASAQTTCPLLGIDSATTTSSTLWDINTTTGAASNPRTVSGFPNRAPLCIDFSPSGVLYGVSLGGPGVPASGMLFTINPSSGATTFVANLTQYINVEGDIAFDPT